MLLINSIPNLESSPDYKIHNYFMNNQTLAAQRIVQTQTDSCFCSLQFLFVLCFIGGVFRIIRFLRVVLGPYVWWRKDLKKRYGGGWAVITGGSQGIGEAIANQIAKSGFSLFLVSRSVQKLGLAKERIKKQNPSTEIEIVSINFEKITTQKQYRDAFENILQKDVSLLVNNVGYYNPYQFDKLKFQQLRTQLKVNLLPISVLTRLFSQKFLRRQRKSGIINLSSGAALSVYKGACNYSATKTFDDFFSRAVEYQLRNKVDVLTVRPYFITTPMTRNMKGLLYVSPQTLGKAAVDCLGNTDICYGGFLHRIQGALSTQIDQKMVTVASNIAMQGFKQSYLKAQ